MDKQELILKGLIIFCCGLIVVSPLLSIFFSNILISTLVLYALILLVPAVYWHYVSGKILAEKSIDNKKVGINLSSILLGIFCGVISGVCLVLTTIVSVLSNSLVSLERAGAMSSYTGILNVFKFDPISSQIFFAFIFLFLLENVVITTLFIAKKKGFGSAEIKTSLKKNLLVAVILFGIFFVLSWFLGNYLLTPLFSIASAVV